MAAVSKLRPMVTAIRYAIYTRKSTDEGLDSDFNTLDAQRESAEAAPKQPLEKRPVRLCELRGGLQGGPVDALASRLRQNHGVS